MQLKQKRTKQMILCYVISVLIIIGDRLVKNYIVNTLELYEIGLRIPGIIHLTYLRNEGASFSILQGQKWLFVVLTIIAGGFIIWLIARRKFNMWGMLSLAFILGGAIGNLIDRLAFSYVIDMFEVEFIEYAVFNLADSFIVVGGIIFIIYYLFFEGKDKKKEQKESEQLDGKN